MVEFPYNMLRLVKHLIILFRRGYSQILILIPSVSLRINRMGSPYPAGLNFNSVSAALIGVPQMSDQGTLNLTISANDHVSGITNITFLLFVGNPIPQPSTLRQGRLFNFSIPPDTFAVGDGITWRYRANSSSGGMLPDWLSFDTSTLDLTGIPPLSVTGIVSLDIIAQDTNNDTMVAPLETGRNG